jgi:hypothetical protein
MSIRAISRPVGNGFSVASIMHLASWKLRHDNILPGTDTPNYMHFEFSSGGEQRGTSWRVVIPARDFGAVAAAMVHTNRAEAERAFASALDT